ncbi:hypothetical protein N9B17_00395 [Rhodopirellula sp.]|nr:hypothetical protein [Rhodopirellula sp.]
MLKTGSLVDDGSNIPSVTPPKWRVFWNLGLLLKLDTKARSTRIDGREPMHLLLSNQRTLSQCQ